MSVCAGIISSVFLLTGRLAGWLLVAGWLAGCNPTRPVPTPTPSSVRPSCRSWVLAPRVVQPYYPLCPRRCPLACPYSDHQAQTTTIQVQTDRTDPTNDHDERGSTFAIQIWSILRVIAENLLALLALLFALLLLTLVFRTHPPLQTSRQHLTSSLLGKTAAPSLLAALPPWFLPPHSFSSSVPPPSFFSCLSVCLTAPHARERRAKEAQ